MNTPSAGSNRVALKLLAAIIVLLAATWLLFHLQRFWASQAVAIAWHARHHNTVHLAGYSIPVGLDWLASGTPGGWVLERGGYGGAPRHLIMFLYGSTISKAEFPPNGVREFTRPLPGQVLNLAGAPIHCQAFGSENSAEVLSHCVGSDGLVVTAVGPPEIQAELHHELTAISQESRAEKYAN